MWILKINLKSVMLLLFKKIQKKRKINLN